MILLGEIALWIALPVALWGMVLSFVGGKQGRGDLVLSGERSVYAVFGLLVVVSVAIIVAFLTDRFDYFYVYSYSNRSLDTFYKVSGLWSGQRGSLVFWVLLLSMFSAITSFGNRRKNREFMPYVAGTLLTIISFFLIVLLFADVNPFEKLEFVPADGRGLNPQLQNYWMTIHPPTLYLGFTAFTIPFAFAISALLNGRLDARWLVLTRRWILLSWFFLANGIVFGMRWAYEELGWGGYWFWDPVENASLLPWLTATAFLHSIQIQENRGMLKVWNMGLVVLTFILTIFATFLTRSGLIESVHTFAQELKIAYIFLTFMSLVIVICVVLIVWRLPQLRSENQIQSFLSRESAFLFNNLMLLAATFTILWGTLLPLITEGLFGEKIGVGPPFFNRINIPIGLTLLALMGVGPVIAWRRASKRNLQKNFLVPVMVGVAVFAGFALRGSREWLALLTFGLSAFAMSVIVVEFWKGTRARARIGNEGHLRAFYHLVSRNRRRWGGYVVHIGVIMIFTAFAGEAFDSEIEQTVSPGDVIVISSPFGYDYTLEYMGLSTQRRSGNLDWQAIASMKVSKDGQPVGILITEKRKYFKWDRPMTEVGILSSPFEDLYVIFADAEDLGGALANAAASQRVTLVVQVNPLVGWIWYGALMLTIGSLFAIWPSRGGIPQVKTAEVMGEPIDSGILAGVSAGD